MFITFFRTVFLFLLVTLIMRIMGKRQIGELQPYELVVTLLISELAAIPMASSDLPLLSGIIPMLILLLSQLTISWWALKSNRAREFICGKPAVLIERGRIMEEALLSTRLNLTDLLELLRIKGFADPTQVEFAILETCGQLSVIPKSLYKPVTIEDLGLTPPPEEAPPVLIVMDGRLIGGNLKIAGLTRPILDDMLAKEGINGIEELFFAAIDQTEGLLYQKNSKKSKAKKE
ncbi:MAG: DUF421 domain-containing protein [Clostridiales bacterium]